MLCSAFDGTQMFRMFANAILPQLGDVKLMFGELAEEG